jgi:RNA polymerase sigma-70 factor (ECF subfamily)
LAEEAAQEALIRLLRPNCVFATQGDGSFKNWFWGVVRNAAKMQLRKERSVRRREQDCRSIERSAALCLEKDAQAVEPDDRYGLLNEALFGLREEFRTVVSLHYFDGMTQVDIARMLNVSQPTVKKRLDKGLALLRRRLAGSGLELSTAAMTAWLAEAVPVSAPPTLATQVFGVASQAAAVWAGQTAAQTFRSAITAGWTLKIAAAVGTAALSVGVWRYEHTRGTHTEEAAPEEISSSSDAVLYRWDFESGPPAELKSHRGEVVWTKNGGIHGGGGLASGGNNSAFFYLPKGLPDELILEADVLPPTALRLDEAPKIKESLGLGADGDVIPPLASTVNGVLSVGYKTVDPKNPTPTAKEFGIFEARAEMYAPRIHRWEVYLNLRESFMGFKVDGRPMQFERRFAANAENKNAAYYDDAPISLQFMGVLDNLTIKKAPPSAWHDWQACLREEEHFFGLQRFINNKFGLSSCHPAGHCGILPDAGPDGSPAMVMNGSTSAPAVFVLRSQVPLSSKTTPLLIRFDGRTVSENVSEIMRAFWSDGQNVAAGLDSVALYWTQTPPPAVEATPLEKVSSSLPANRWRDIVFLLKGKRCVLLADGEIKAIRDELRESFDFGKIVLYFNAPCIVDNLRWRPLDSKRDERLLGKAKKFFP